MRQPRGSHNNIVQYRRLARLARLEPARCFHHLILSGETLCRLWGGIAEAIRMCVNPDQRSGGHRPMIERLGGAERMECRRE